MGCISLAAFNLQVDGHKVSTFNPKRGVRQGDPFSPYMFIVASKVLSLMIQTHIEKKDLKGVKLACNTPACHIVSLRMMLYSS